MKYFTIIILLSVVFCYIDQPCDAGLFGYGVCVKNSSCTLYGNQEGYAFDYDRYAPRSPCRSDPSDVVCCVKHVSRLRDGVTYKKGECLNVNLCKENVIDTLECPGSNNVKLCVGSETIINSRVYKVNDRIYYLRNDLGIKNYPYYKSDNIGTIRFGNYIFSTDSEYGYIQFYKGYVNDYYLTEKNSKKANYKVNVDLLNFRIGPDTSFRILETLTFGSEIVYYSRDHWNKKWAVTNKGYCYASHLTKINGTPTPTPTTSPSITNAGDISTKFEGTLLSKSSFIEKVSSYCQNRKGKIDPNLCNNAGKIYDASKSSDVNALLVIVRAIVEGNSPGPSKNNYWGIGCFNGGGLKACFSYKSLEDGVRGFAQTVSKYNNLAEMLSKYAYIGRNWYNPGSASVGGCYYFPYIKQYMSPQRRNTVSYICSKSTKCTISGGDCTSTTNEDQKAYSTWQVEQKMAPTIREVFGIY